MTTMLAFNNATVEKSTCLEWFLPWEGFIGIPSPNGERKQQGIPSTMFLTTYQGLNTICVLPAPWTLMISQLTSMKTKGLAVLNSEMSHMLIVLKYMSIIQNTLGFDLPWKLSNSQVESSSIRVIEMEHRNETTTQLFMQWEADWIPSMEFTRTPNDGALIPVSFPYYWGFLQEQNRSNSFGMGVPSLGVTIYIYIFILHTHIIYIYIILQ